METNTVLATDSIVSVTSLRKTYRGGVTALDGLTFSVAQGTVFGVLGPNGAGKSTAVKILTTLSYPDEGAASIAGLDVLAQPEAVRRSIGYVAQRSGADIQSTGLENLVLQARINGFDRGEARRRAAELLERLGLSESGDRLVKTWSGGMRRRLDIALALVHGPQILFLDEPTTGLDPEVRAELWDLIRRLRDEDGATVLLTTHYLEEGDQLADRIVIIDHGRVVAEGTPGQLKDGMRGDAIHIELTAPDMVGSAMEVLAAGNHLREVVVEGRSVHARADRGAEAVPLVLAALDAAGVRVLEVTVNRPSLDDVFLRHTGRRFVTIENERTA
jgi:ABC-2 type transport system ATP-binding protein